jgi:hypothetical protein
MTDKTTVYFICMLALRIRGHRSGIMRREVLSKAE